MEHEARLRRSSRSRTTQPVVAVVDAILQARDAARLELIEQTVAELRDLSTKASLELATALARVLIHRLYSGDTTAWRRRSRGGLSLRAIANHPEVPFSCSTLYRALAVSEVVERLGGLEACAGLSSAHFQTTLRLAPADQERLLRNAQLESLSANELRDRCSKLAPWGRAKGGRRVVPQALRAIRAWARNLSDTHFDHGELRRSLTGQAAEEFAARVEQVVCSLQAMSRAVCAAEESPGGNAAHEPRIRCANRDRFIG